MTVNKVIVAIGGGEFRKNETLLIDKEIVSLAKKQSPKLLFIPTASSDSQSYFDSIKNYFTGLGCQCDVLYLLDKSLSFEDIQNKILSTDIIYVGGGNTLKMMRRWRKLKVDKLLKTAWEKGVVLSGISAGSICWFDFGHSDSALSYYRNSSNYIKVKGLGFLKGIHCPHYNSESKGVPRKEDFIKMIQKTGGIGIAIDEACAIKFVNEEFQVIQSKKNAHAYRLFKKNGKVVSSKIDEHKSLKPIKDLYNY